jgi:hypothetical protein
MFTVALHSMVSLRRFVAALGIRGKHMFAHGKFKTCKNCESPVSSERRHKKRVCGLCSLDEDAEKFGARVGSYPY